MTHTLAPADADHYYQRLAELSTLPLWQLPDITEQAGPECGHVWHWRVIYPELARSRETLDDAAALLRRALCLRNPGLTPPAISTTHTLAATYQMIFPGETAPVRAHSMSALRFGLTSRRARVIIDGDRVPMEPGDLVLTPGWSWHGHVHPGGDEPVAWFDGLDVPFVLGLRAGFYRDHPHADNPLPARDTTGTAVSPAALAPAGDGSGHHSPVRRYPWQQAYPALQRLMARASQHSPVARLEYRNPVTGGPALATLACLLEGMPAITQTRPSREPPARSWSSPAERDSRPRQPHLRATPQRRRGHPGMDLAPTGHTQPGTRGVPHERPAYPGRLRPLPGGGDRRHPQPSRPLSSWRQVDD